MLTPREAKTPIFRFYCLPLPLHNTTLSWAGNRKGKMKKWRNEKSQKCKNREYIFWEIVKIEKWNFVKIQCLKRGIWEWYIIRPWFKHFIKEHLFFGYGNQKKVRLRLGCRTWCIYYRFGFLSEPLSRLCPLKN